MKGPEIGRRDFLGLAAGLLAAACTRQIRVDDAFSDRLAPGDHNPDDEPWFINLKKCHVAVANADSSTIPSLIRLHDETDHQGCAQTHEVKGALLEIKEAIRNVFRNCGNIPTKEIGRETYGKIFELFLRRRRLEDIKRCPR